LICRGGVSALLASRMHAGVVECGEVVADGQKREPHIFSEADEARAPHCCCRSGDMQAYMICAIPDDHFLLNFCLVLRISRCILTSPIEKRQKFEVFI